MASGLRTLGDSHWVLWEAAGSGLPSFTLLLPRWSMKEFGRGGSFYRPLWWLLQLLIKRSIHKRVPY